MQPPNAPEPGPGNPLGRPAAPATGPLGPLGRQRRPVTDAAAAAEAAAFAAQARRALDRHLPAEDYRPLSLKRHLWLALAGVLTACALFWVLAERPGQQGIDRRLLQADNARCAPGQTQNCVGGQAQVILVPAAPTPRQPASAARP